MRIIFFFLILASFGHTEYLDINSTSPELNFQYMTMGNLLGFVTTFLLILLVVLGVRK